MKKPKLKLIGKDGNAFAIMGRAVEKLKKAKYSKEDQNKYMKEAMSGDYQNLLKVTANWFEVS